MFHNISNPKWFGNWSRLEDDYLGNGGTDIADNFTFSKREKTGGLFGSIISLATAFPACDPETGHATGAWKVACESIDLDEVPLSDIADMISGFSIEQVKRFPELLASPVVLANSPTRNDVLLAILLATDAYDTPLIAGIKPDGTGNYGEREVETNMVLSVYSRQNFIRYFALLRDMDAFVFVSGRKIEALEDLSGLPLAENCSGLDIDRILQRPKCLG